MGCGGCRGADAEGGHHAWCSGRHDAPGGAMLSLFARARARWGLTEDVWADSEELLLLVLGRPAHCEHLLLILRARRREGLPSVAQLVLATRRRLLGQRRQVEAEATARGLGNLGRIELASLCALQSRLVRFGCGRLRGCVHEGTGGHRAGASCTAATHVHTEAHGHSHGRICDSYHVRTARACAHPCDK